MSVEKTPEVVNHPPHYQTEPFQCTEAIDVIEGFKLGFHEGNAIKYILRAGKKGNNRNTDLRKAIWYLERLLPDS